jgi:hypothetical protein
LDGACSCSLVLKIPAGYCCDRQGEIKEIFPIAPIQVNRRLGLDFRGSEWRVIRYYLVFLGSKSGIFDQPGIMGRAQPGIALTPHDW